MCKYMLFSTYFGIFPNLIANFNLKIRLKGSLWAIDAPHSEIPCGRIPIFLTNIYFTCGQPLLNGDLHI